MIVTQMQHTAPVVSLPKFLTMNCRLLVATLTLCISACATVTTKDSPNSQALLGTWEVDLRPRPDAPAYIKNFVITSVSGNKLQGMFYDTEITEGRINVDWGKAIIAFVTSDGSGPYNHSAVLSDGKLEGLTNSTGRNFLAYWSASKK